MPLSRLTKIAGLILICFLILLTAGAQTSLPAKPDESSYDVQLFLLHATNRAVSGKSSLPPAVASVVKQLKATLPYANYQPVMNFLNRVKNGGGLSLNGPGTFEIKETTGPGSNYRESFYQYTIHRLQASQDAAGQTLVKIEPFRFNLRYPALTPASTPDGKSYSVLQYQDTHLNAEVLTPLGTPTLIGTFGPNTSDDTYVLILLVKETPQR